MCKTLRGTHPKKQLLLKNAWSELKHKGARGGDDVIQGKNSERTIMW